VPGLSSLSSALNFSQDTRTSDVILIPLDYTDTPVTNDYFRFQYFPESISDGKSVNWSTKDIPGGSLPLYQWINSGERPISFTATFTTDIDFGGLDPVSGQALVQRIHASGVDSRNVDPRAAVAWLRRFTLPAYNPNVNGGGSGNTPGSDVGTVLTYAPRKLILFIPNSGIGLAGGDAGNGFTVSGNSVLVIMTQCEVTWESYFPSGFPRVVSVSLAFAQLPQFQGAVYFPSDTQNLDNLVTSGTGALGATGTPGIFAYNLKPRPGTAGIPPGTG
jgi:hypothetical protein